MLSPRTVTTIALLVLSCGRAVAQDWESRGVIPEWYSRSLPVERGNQGLAMVPSTSPQCDPLVKIGITDYIIAIYYDPQFEKTRIFVGDYPASTIREFGVDAKLGVSCVSLPIPYGLPWVVSDLDGDGVTELAVQRGDPGASGNGYLDIYSMADWSLRQRFVQPNMKVFMNPAEFHINGDSLPKLYVTPSEAFLGSARAQIISYNAQADSFETVADIPAPTGTGGTSAIGDFDEDGVIEFVTGNSLAYDLFECSGSSLSHVGPVGDPYPGWYGRASRPTHDALLHAILGHSSSTIDWRHQLLSPLDDNQFEVVEVFERTTGLHGVGPVWSADSDCDGLDELLMTFSPSYEVWGWNDSSAGFEPECGWLREAYGTMMRFYSTDLNQDGVPEWCAVNHLDTLLAFTTPCIGCLSPPPSMAAWWPLDEQAGLVAAEVWAGNDGQHTGGVVPGSGVVDRGIWFDGLSGIVTAPNRIAFSLGSGDFTVDAWINTTGLGVLPILSKFDETADRGWALWIADTGSIRLRIGDGSSLDLAAIDTTTITDGLWHHVAVTVDRDQLNGVRFFVDGNTIGYADPTGHQGDLDSEVDWLIGAGLINSDTSFFGGTLDEVRLWSRALTHIEVRSVVAAGPYGNCKPDSVPCNCPGQGDPNASHTIDATDLAIEIDVVFFGEPDVGDPACPASRTDINADSLTDAVDLALMIDHVFFGGNGPDLPCEQ